MFFGMTRSLLVLALLVVAVSDTRVRGNQNPQRPSPDVLLQSGAIPIYPPIPRSARMAGTVEIAVTVQRGNVVRAERSRRLTRC
jgi:outer membrane biosynthesis protein TonB